MWASVAPFLAELDISLEPKFKLEPPISSDHALNLLFSERELTFTFAICYRPSVCRLSVCRLSVTLVRPTQAVQIFRNISTQFGTLAIR